MGLFDSIFSSGASGVVNSVAKVVDNLVTTKGEKLELENEIKKAQYQYEIEMRKMDIEEKAQTYADTKDARAMATSVQTSPSSSKLSKNVGPYLAIGTTLLTFTLFFMLLFFSSVIDTTKEKLAYYILGVLSATVTQIFSFYFGSSQSSKDKNQTIQNLSESTK